MMEILKNQIGEDLVDFDFSAKLYEYEGSTYLVRSTKSGRVMSIRKGYVADESFYTSLTQISLEFTNKQLYGKCLVLHSEDSAAMTDFQTEIWYLNGKEANKNEVDLIQKKVRLKQKMQCL